MVDVQEVSEFIGVSPNDPVLPGLLAAASTLVDAYLGTGKTRCPDELLNLSIRLVTRRLWDIYKSSNGVVQWGPDGESSFLPADMLKPVTPILARFRGLGAVG